MEKKHCVCLRVIQIRITWDEAPENLDNNISIRWNSGGSGDRSETQLPKSFDPSLD